MKSGVHCFTSVSFSYLDRARTLAQTVQRHHPDWHMWLCLSDREPPGFRFELVGEPFDHLVRIEELSLPPLLPWAFGHDVVELCTAVKGPMLLRLLELGAEKVVYLDPDIALLSDMADLVELLDRQAVVLTPHLVDPETESIAVLDNEINSALKHGVYNLGFFAVRNTNEGFRFARWWRDRLLDYCVDDIPAGLFTDQRWCDLVPALFDGVGIWRDPGCNVASWNLGQRPLAFDSVGQLTAKGARLRFFHFTKVNAAGETMLERYSQGRVEVFELLRWYRSRLEANASGGIPDGWWAFGTFEDGSVVPKDSRRLYRQRPDLQSAFSNPFLSGSGSYQEWYAAHGGAP